MSDTIRTGSRLELPWRIAAWGGSAALLATPAIAMQFSDEWNWGPGAFVLLGAVLLVCCVTFELVARRASGFAHRAGTAIAIAGGLLLFWGNLAVGFIGDEDNPANLAFYALLLAGVAGGFLAGFRPRGLSRVLLAMAAAQILIGVIAITSELDDPTSLAKLTGIFTAIWLISSLLFRHASRRTAGHDEAGSTP